jgi:hypothetical protein
MMRAIEIRSIRGTTPMTGHDDVTTTTPERSMRERLSHSARITLIAFQRRDRDTTVDREAARRITVTRLNAGAML